MRISSKLFAATVLSGGLALASVPAHAVTLAPFATYTMQGTKSTIDWTKSGLHNGSIFSTKPGKSNPGSPTVTFNFLDTSKYLSNVNAKLTLNGSETGVNAVGSVDQAGILGSFSFIYEGATTSFMGKTYTHDVTNLLTGTYTLAHITGAGTSGSFHDATDIGTVTYTSDIIDFTNSVARDFSFSLNALSPPFGYVAGNSLNTFKASSTGIFSAAFVPEPATWAMIISGFGMLGLAARRRRSLSFAAA
jgi:hypothetical protein